MRTSQPAHCRPIVWAGLLAFWSTAAALAAPARAQPAPVTTGAQGEDREVEAKRSEARRAFEKGLAFFEREAWDAALGEFVRSRSIYPTRAATENAAFCLRRLRRLDEALEMLEELLKFVNLPADKRRSAEAAVAELGKTVGTLRLEGAEVGASIVVDGRYRGALPLPRPLRVNAGTHEIRAFKEGMDPLGTTVEVKGRAEAVVQLRSLSTGGRLRVAEQHQRLLDVVVDGSVVGKTPWEGPLSVGEHLVTLRGDVNLDAIPECAAGDEGAAGKQAARRGRVELGTQPVTVPIRLRELTKLTLAAEALDTTLRVEPTPGGARVAIDAVEVGRGAWEGRLRVGEHTVEVTAEGFVPRTERVNLERRKRHVVRVELERDRGTASYRRARNVGAGVSFGVGALGLGVGTVTAVLALMKSDQVKSRCSGNLCPASVQPDLDAVHTLGKVSTAGFVLGGAGVVAGTVVLLVARPGERAVTGSGLVWKAGVGLGRLNLEGSF